MFKARTTRALLLFLAALLAGGCSSYYRRTIDFQERFSRGEYESALNVLDRNRRAARPRDRLLYLLQRGETLHLLGRYEESNDELEQAYRYVEDLRRNTAASALSLLSNPNVIPYRGEDFEVVQIHYYKALNFLLLGRREEALVECRRLNIRLNQLNDSARGLSGRTKVRYSTDAFALTLMGILFEAAGERNNAFIAYRNAWEAYRDVYAEHFGLEAPVQLKKDLLRSARDNGFTEELRYYEREFGMSVDPSDAVRSEETSSLGGTLIFFWNNGLGPVKEEWSIDFAVIRGRGGTVNFVNQELGLVFPFALKEDGGGGDPLRDLRLVRVAFPRYRERGTFWREASLTIGERRIPLEPLQDLRAIAVSSLEDRMIRELSAALLRLAVKQAAESVVRRENRTLGVLLSIVNAATEAADTRNWQTLPAEVHYARVPLPEGASELSLTLSSRGGDRRTQRFQVEVRRGETKFMSWATPGSR